MAEYFLVGAIRNVNQGYVGYGPVCLKICPDEDGVPRAGDMYCRGEKTAPTVCVSKSFTRETLAVSNDAEPFTMIFANDPQLPWWDDQKSGIPCGGDEDCKISNAMTEAHQQVAAMNAVETLGAWPNTGRAIAGPRGVIINGDLTGMALYVARNIKCHSDLTPNLVFEIHRHVTENALDKHGAAGRFRTDDELIRVTDSEGVVYHDPPPADELDARMVQMCDFANGRTPKAFVHPVIRAILLLFWLAYDHPFYDGNGRTARALFYWSMLRSGYWLFEFVSISSILVKAPAKYARSFLYTETGENDLNYCIIDQTDIINRAIKELHAYIERKRIEVLAAEAQLKYLRHLSHRQQALVFHALRHPFQEYSIASHQRSHQKTVWSRKQRLTISAIR